MVIKYTISPATDVLENFIAKVYEAESPDAEVASQNVLAPHTAPVLITFNGLDRVVHIIKLIGATSGIVYHKYNEEPKEDQVTVFDPIKFKIGDGGLNTPAANATTYTNSLLIGLTTDDFTFFKNGYGFRRPVDHFTFNSGTGVISLVSPDLFSGEGGGDEYWIFRNSKAVTTIVNDSVVGKLYGGFVDVVAPTDYEASHLRKLVRLAGVNAIYTFPVGASIPVGYHHCFTNLGAYADINDRAKVRFLNAPLKWGNATITELELPFTSTYAFSFDGTNWNVTQYSSNTTADAPYAYVSFKGSYYIGDIIAPDEFYTVTIPDQGGTNYIVLATVCGNGPDRNTENDIVVSVTNYGKTATSFGLNVRALADQVEAIQIDYIVIKT